MRLFVACLIPNSVRERLASVRAAVGDLAGLKWVTPENLHITLKFLGEVEPSRLASLKGAISDVAARHAPLSLTLSGIGKFGSPAQLRVLWAGISAGGRELSALADSVDECVARLGFERESRPFSAHLTLARGREGADTGAAWQRAQTVRGAEFGTFRVDSLHLMESELRPSGPVYREISESRLGR